MLEKYLWGGKNIFSNSENLFKRSSILKEIHCLNYIGITFLRKGFSHYTASFNVLENFIQTYSFIESNEFIILTEFLQSFT